MTSAKQKLHEEAYKLAEREAEILKQLQPLLKEQKQIQNRIYEIAKELRK